MNAHDLVKKDPKYSLLAMTSFMPVLQNIAADIADALAALIIPRYQPMGCCAFSACDSLFDTV